MQLRKTMPHSQTVADSPNLQPASRSRFAGLLPSVIISAGLPVLIYWLASPHLSTLPTLALMAVPPTIYTLYSWARTRSIDVISVFALISLAVSLLVTLFVHDPRLFLIRDSYLTGVFGLLCLISLATPRPLAYYVYRWAFARTPVQLAVLDARSQTPRGRFVQRVVTAIWGLAFVGETLLDAFLAYHLPTAQFVAIHPFLFWGTILVTMGGATLYSRHAQKTLAQPSASQG